MNSTCNCIFCITPPHMTENIIKYGNQIQKERAFSVLKHSAEIRGRRSSVAGLNNMFAKAAQPGKNRIIYNAGFGSNLPGQLVRSEGQPAINDVAVNEAYDGSGHTYDLYYDIFGRDSIDANGMDLISTVHYQQGYDNAFWDGSQMIYGDGDEDLPEPDRLFNRFTIAIDIIAHELTHGVTQYEAELQYYQQAGALNESFSDVFGVLVKQKVLNQTVNQADWLIGAGLFTSNVNGTAIRSMKNPGTAYNDPVLGKDPQPGHMNDYVNTVSDNGGVHINSGIPNKAFYLTAMEIGGNAWEKAGNIWYRALCEKLQPQSNFQDAANFTYQVAEEHYGEGSQEQEAVRKGWEGVGVMVGSTEKKGCLNFLGLKK